MLHMIQQRQLARLAVIGLVLQHDVHLCQHWSTMMVSNAFSLAMSCCSITLGVIGIYLTQLNLLADATLTLHSLTGPSFCVLCP